MSTKKFFIIAFAAAAIITTSMTAILAHDNDSYTLKYEDSSRIYRSSADSADTSDGIIIPPIGH